jgi:hypothetical protein
MHVAGVRPLAANPFPLGVISAPYRVAKVLVLGAAHCEHVARDLDDAADIEVDLQRKETPSRRMKALKPVGLRDACTVLIRGWLTNFMGIFRAAQTLYEDPEDSSHQG